MKVYGVWEHGWEHSTLYGLYRHRADAETQLATMGAEGGGCEIEEHPTFDSFPGVDGLGYATPLGVQAELIARYKPPSR